VTRLTRPLIWLAALVALAGFALPATAQAGGQLPDGAHPAAQVENVPLTTPDGDDMVRAVAPTGGTAVARHTAWAASLALIGVSGVVLVLVWRRQASANTEDPPPGPGDNLGEPA
jgi:hypothetical protein